MATLRQKKLAKAVVENIDVDKPLKAGELLESVGYAHSVAIGKPGEILQQKGVREELTIYGFNNETADQVVTEILIGGENDNVKLKAADIVYKRTGGYAAEKHIIATLDESTERTRELGNKLLGLLRR